MRVKRNLFIITIITLTMILVSCSTNNKQSFSNKKESGYYGFDTTNRIKAIEEKGYYEDSVGNKFDSYLSSEHFEIYYNSSNEEIKNSVSSYIEILEENYDRILNFLTVKEEDMPKVKIHVYETFEILYQAVNEEDLFQFDFRYDGITLYQNVFYILPTDQNTFIHEFTHNVTMTLTNVKIQPNWLFEGVAMYLSQQNDSYEDYYEIILKEGLPPIYFVSNNQKECYKYGYSMVEYIIENFGEEKIPELLLAYGDIEKVLSVSLDEFKEGWKNFLEKKVGER